MTADIELLPLPKWLLEGFTDPTIERLCDYTRANVEHYVKELQEEVARVRGLWGDAEILGHKLYDQNATKDAEIEALRAEVLRLRTDNSESFRDAAILANIRRDEAEARVERLAEALHKLEEACDDSDGAQYGTLGTSFVRGICKDALLRDHDQELSNG